MTQMTGSVSMRARICSRPNCNEIASIFSGLCEKHDREGRCEYHTPFKCNAQPGGLCRNKHLPESKYCHLHDERTAAKSGEKRASREKLKHDLRTVRSQIRTRAEKFARYWADAEREPNAASQRHLAADLRRLGKELLAVEAALQARGISPGSVGN